MSQVLITESKLDNLADALGDKISLTLPATIDEMTEAVIDYTPWTSGAYLDNDGYIRISPNAAAGGVDFDNGYIILDNQIKSSFNDGLYLDPNGSLIISDTACDIENVIIRNNSLILPPNIFPKYKTYSVTENLTYTLSNNAVKDVEENSSLIIDIEAEYKNYFNGRITDVTVIMSGVDITDQVFIKPLGSKTITENGIYNASTDNLSGYSEVTVNIIEDFKDYLENTNNLIINSNATSVKSGGITGGNVKAIILPECTSLADGAICYASYTNGARYFTKLEELQLPKVEALGTMSLCGFRTECTLNSVVLPSLKTITWSASNGKAFDFSDAIIKWDFGNPSITSMSWGSGMHFYRCSPSIEAIIFRYGGVVAIDSVDVFRYNNTTNLPLGTTTFIYVPSNLLAQYKTATNWSSLYANYPDMFKTIEGSYYETHYADGTEIDYVD